MFRRYLNCIVLMLLFCTCKTNRIKESCETCRDIVKNFKKGMDKTAKDHFGGGDTAWEESRLGSYARSETRLLEILENVCEGTGKESRCHAIVEEYEEKIENFWFNKHNELSDLEKFLCIETMTVCCNEGKFGETCEDCPGGSEKPCSGNGNCVGSGTRSGSGKCKCNDGYEGEICTECSDGYYDSGNQTCLKCDESCESTCSDGSPKGCDDCKEGYTQDEEKGCLDKNECEEDDICVEGKYCVNTKGSYRCGECDRACDGGCTGSGRQNCNKCKEGWREVEGGKGCEDVNECEQENVCTDVGTYCKNNEGLYTCEYCHAACKDGCTGGGPGSCVACADGYEMKENEGCVDVDQCAIGLLKCKHGQVCVNNDGVDSCEPCHPSCQDCVSMEADGCLNCNNGYTFKKTKCEDINECLKSPCNKETENCHNTVGSYKCKCKKGWVRTKKGHCTKKTATTKTKKKKKSKKDEAKKTEDKEKAEIKNGDIKNENESESANVPQTQNEGKETSEKVEL